VQVGEVLGEAWDLYKRFFLRFFLTALVVFVLLDLLSGLAAWAAGGGFWSGLFWGLVAAATGIIGYFWVQIALVETVHDVRDGRADRSIGETFGAVRPQLPAAIVAGVVAGIAIVIGFILLIVPGLFLLTIWSMLIPVIVLERRSVGEAFGRSWEVVRGNAWNVFGLIIVTFVLIFVAGAVVRLVFAPLPDFLGGWLGSVVADCLTTPFAAAALTTAYFHLTARASAEPTPVTPTAS
jgi:hypothetical protein